MHWLLFIYLLLRLLHVSTLMCHLQEASFILVSYWKSEMVVSSGCTLYCKCWWPVCTGCCSFLRNAQTTSGAYARNHNIRCLRTKLQHPVPTHETTTSGAYARNYNIRCLRTKLQHPVHTGHQHLQYRGTSRWHNHFGLLVTHKDKGRSLKMAYKCRNM
jgi:hypothetical protein